MYCYEYEYEYDHINMFGEIRWLISTKLYAYPIIYVLVLLFKTTKVDHVLEARRCHHVHVEGVGIWSKMGIASEPIKLKVFSCFI